MNILVINCGSSSIKYKLYEMETERECAGGLIERLGEPEAHIKHHCGAEKIERNLPGADYASGVREVLALLTSFGTPPPLRSADEIDGVGHRIVHGGESFQDSVLIDDEVIAAIDACSEIAPLHNPANLKGVRAAMDVLPDRPHAAVFDTAFFQTMPPEAYIYALPYEWYTEQRVRRYGFHGTSHRFVTASAAELLEKPKPNLVTLHLGNGCSMSCIRAGRAIDQTMGFTPLEGLVMGTRCGDIDPAIIFHMLRAGLSEDDVHTALEKKSGLLGISGVSRDLRDVLSAAGSGNERAALAVGVFAHRARKYLGGFLAELGTCDAVVFTGGIGENSAEMRAKILAGLAPLGLELDDAANAVRSPSPRRIAREGSRTDIWVIPTNEELMIARDTRALATVSASSR